MLGEGAMGRVYRARDVHLDRPVALKLLGARTLGDPTFLERFQREAKLAAQLNHPNIATIYAFGKVDGEPYIAMELVEGETLAEVLARGPLPVAQVRKFGRQAASALAAAHARGIVHRDIKTSNLMVTPDGDLKVMDFGVARRSGDTQLTMEGGLVGTANIMAPEIVRGEGAGPEADLFSLGCVLYEALAGRSAFVGDDAMAVLFQVVNKEPPSLAELRPETPADLVEIVHGLLRKTPAERLGPARVVAERLGGEVASVPPEETMALGGDRTVVLEGTRNGDGEEVAQPLWRRRRVLGAALGALALVVAGWFVLRPTGPSVQDQAQARELNQTGVAFLKRGQPDSAAAYFERSIALAPRDTTWDNLAQAALWLEDPQAAERYARRAVAMSSSFARARGRLGDALTDQGRYEEAESEYRIAFADAKLVQDSVSIANNLGSLFNETDRPDSTLRWLAPFVKRFPAPAILKNYGIALQRKGAFQTARTMLESAWKAARDANASEILREVEEALYSLPDSLGLGSAGN